MGHAAAWLVGSVIALSLLNPTNPIPMPNPNPYPNPNNGNPNLNPNPNPNLGPTLTYKSTTNPDLNTNPNPNPNSNFDLKLTPHLNPNPNPNSNPNPNPNPAHSKYTAAILQHLSPGHIGVFNASHDSLTRAPLPTCHHNRNAAGFRLAISILAFEELPLLLNTILNAINFTRNSTLVILHLNKHSPTSTLAGAEALHTLQPLAHRCRFLLNRYRIPIKYYLHGREVSGITAGHMLNFAYIRDLRVPFDSFLFMASNMRFFRCGIEHHVRMNPSVANFGEGSFRWGDGPLEIYKEPSFWKMFYNMTEHEAAATFRDSLLYLGQWGYADGFYASTAAFESFHRFLIDRQGYSYIWKASYWEDGVWPATFIGMMNATPGSPIPTSRWGMAASTCAMFLSPSCNTTLLDQVQRHPGRFFSVKRVQRNLSDPVVHLLTELGAHTSCQSEAS